MSPCSRANVGAFCFALLISFVCVCVCACVCVCLCLCVCVCVCVIEFIRLFSCCLLCLLDCSLDVVD